MKKILAMILLLPLVGCGVSDYRETGLIQVEEKRLDVQAACLALEAEEAKKAEQVQPTQPLSEIGYMFKEYMKTTKETMVAISGKTISKCGIGGTNLNDVAIAEVRAKNDTAQKAIGGGVTLGTTAIVADAAKSILGKAFDSAGDKSGGDMVKDGTISTGGDKIQGDKIGGDKVGNDKAGYDQTGGNKDGAGDQTGGSKNPEPTETPVESTL